MAENTTPIPGDILFTDRGLYKHYGVYIGHGQVIHFAGPVGHETEAHLADIIQTSIKDFLRGDELYIERYPDYFKYKPFEPKEVINRAKSRLGMEKGKYNLADYNCEHFANWCKYGVEFSSQVEQVAAAIVKITGPVLKFLYWLSSTPNDTTYPAEKIVDSVGLEDILRFFKEYNRLKLLRSDSNLLPIVIKEQFDENFSVIGCLFNKSTKEIINGNTFIWQTEHLEDDLVKIFGDHDMIILQ